MKRLEMQWLASAVAMLLMCAAVLGACGKLKQVQGVEPKALSGSWVVVKFAVEDEESASEAYALVDPWELEEGEAWKCEIGTGELGYQLVVVVQRDKMSSSGFLVGLVEAKDEGVSTLSAGSFPMGESDAMALNIAGNPSRTLMIEVVSGVRAAEIRKQSADFVECERRMNSLTPERVK